MKEKDKREFHDVPVNEADIDLYTNLKQIREDYIKYGCSDVTIDDIWEEAKKIYFDKKQDNS